MPKRYLFILTTLLIIKTAWLLAVILHSGIGLGPDEAQYWTWSRQLDWGYYSKPPGIAWEIWAGTALFGDTELGVRAMPLVIGFILPFLIYALAKRCGLTPSGSLWAAIAMALSPIGIFSSFLAITDGGMVLFWTAACAYYAGKIAKREEVNYLDLGLLILCGALFKWTQYTFWIAVLASWYFFPYLASRRALGGFVLSLAALIPSVYWNASHEWATFRHVSSTLAGGHGNAPGSGLFPGNPLDFLGAQSVLVSPILFVLLFIGLWRLFRIKASAPPAIMFCGGVTFAVFLTGLIASLFMKIQGNWVIFAYPTAFPVLGWLAETGSAAIRRWLAAGIALSAVLCALVFAIPYLQSQGTRAAITIPYKISPFRHNVGWNALPSTLRRAGYRPGEDYLFSDKYQTVSILSFYGPQQRRAYFFNLQGARKNQFSYWPGLEEEQRDKTGYFAVIENVPQLDDPALAAHYEKLLADYFDSVRFLGKEPLFEANGAPVKGMLIFESKGFKGDIPQDPSLY